MPRPVRHPKPQPALLIEASQTLRAIIHGRGGHVTLVRGREAFTVTDLEAELLIWARERFLGREEVPGG